MTFPFWKTSFVHSRSGTYFVLLLPYYYLKFLLDICHCVYWVLHEIWTPDSCQKIGNKFFIHQCQGWKEGSFVCETVWFFSWVNTHPFDLKFVAFLSQIQWRFLCEISGKDNFERIFQKFYANQGYLYQNLWNFAPLSAILFWARIALKKFTQVLSYVVCTQVRRHIHKQITKRRYGDEKPWRFVFGKPVLFTLGLGHTTPYYLGIFVLYFNQTFVTVSIEFCLRFEPQIHATRFAINFLFITVRMKGRFVCVWNCLIFFRGWVLIRLTWNLSRFVPNSVEILMWNFRKKQFRENFS